MTIPFGTQTIRVWRAPLVNDHGTQVRDWENAEPHDESGCMVHPGDGREDRVNRDAVTTVYTVISPPTADVQDYDRVSLFGADDSKYDINGPVQRWLTGVLDHLRIPLRNVEG